MSDEIEQLRAENARLRKAIAAYEGGAAPPPAREPAFELSELGRRIWTPVDEEKP